MKLQRINKTEFGRMNNAFRIVFLTNGRAAVLKEIDILGAPDIGFADIERFEGQQKVFRRAIFTLNAIALRYSTVQLLRLFCI